MPPPPSDIIICYTIVTLCSVVSANTAAINFGAAVSGERLTSMSSRDRKVVPLVIMSGSRSELVLK